MVDNVRAAFAGKGLMRRAVLLYTKGDWAEWAHAFGCPTWRSSLRPCPKCNVSFGDLYNFIGISPVSMPFRTNELEDHETACRRCEFRVVVPSKVVRDSMAPLLWYDKRIQGCGGRCLLRDRVDLG